jgi:hypothetical protein
MDGLSGMKIYQKYTIDSRFLPSNYPESMDFIIIGVSNTIQNNVWVTNIESYAIPKSPPPTKSRSSTSSSSSTSRLQQNPQSKEYESSASPLRNAIVRIATGYIGITEKPIVDEGSFGFTSISFQTSMRSVGWYPSSASEWCNYFTKLVWKQAYNEVGNSDPLVQTIASTTFKNFGTNSPISPAVPTTYNTMKTIKFGSNKNIPGAEKFVKGKTIIQNGDMVIYGNNTHIGIATNINQTTRTYISVDGNYGAKVSKYSVNMDGPNGPTAIIRVVEP